MLPEEFVIISISGAFGIGKFPEIEWHKNEGEHILNKVGIKVEFGEETSRDYGMDKGKYMTVSDMEYFQIIKMRIEGLSYDKLAKEFQRSSGTIYSQVNKHNASIARIDLCERCEKVGGE